MKHSEGIVEFFDKNFNEKKCHDLSRQQFGAPEKIRKFFLFLSRGNQKAPTPL
jgi:hypothetical protein